MVSVSNLLLTVLAASAVTALPAAVPVPAEGSDLKLMKRDAFTSCDVYKSGPLLTSWTWKMSGSSARTDACSVIRSAIVQCNPFGDIGISGSCSGSKNWEGTLTSAQTVTLSCVSGKISALGPLYWGQCGVRN